ncbi:MAG TPA: hypothetical protein VGG33_06030 [Polyangia bacterium]
MNKTSFAFALAGLCVMVATSVAVAAPQQKVALLPMSGTNVHPGYLDAGRDILKDHLLGTGRYQVIAVAGPAGTSELGGDEAVARARDTGAELAIVSHLSRLSGTGRLRLIAYRIGDGSIAHADSIAISGGPDDLDPALKRLAVGLATGNRAAHTADIESVTQKDADPLLKQEATKIFGLRLGALVALNRPGDLDPAALPGIGVFWMYDARSFIGEVSLDLQTRDDEDGTSFAIGIGGYYPLTRTNFTPYVGGSLSYAFVDFGGTGASGLRISPSVGFLFGRLSTVQIRGEVGYFFNTFGERADVAVPTTQGIPLGEKSYAHGPHFGLGLGF